MAVHGKLRHDFYQISDDFTVGDRIAILRFTRKLTQEEVAVKAELSTQTIQEIENGKRRTKPKTETLKAIAKALHFPLEYLINGGNSYPAQWLDDVIDKINAGEMEPLQEFIDNGFYKKKSE